MENGHEVNDKKVLNDKNNEEEEEKETEKKEENGEDNKNSIELIENIDKQVNSYYFKWPFWVFFTQLQGF